MAADLASSLALGPFAFPVIPPRRNPTDIMAARENHTIKEANKRQKLETKIKEQCSKLVYEGKKVSNLQFFLGLLNIQIVYGWFDVSVMTLF